MNLNLRYLKKELECFFLFLLFQNPLHTLKEEMKLLFTQSYLTLYDFMDCSPAGSSVHGILQAIILK